MFMLAPFLYICLCKSEQMIKNPKGDKENGGENPLNDKRESDGVTESTTV